MANSGNGASPALPGLLSVKEFHALEAQKAFDEGAARYSEQDRARYDESPNNYVWAHQLFPFLSFIGDGIDLPTWGDANRDVRLRDISRNNALLSIVTYGESTRVRNADIKLNSEKDSETSLSKAQEMLATCDFGRGFGEFRSKVALDLLTQDNGAFIELLGPGSSESELSGRPLSFAHIDSARCVRTLHPEWPVAYMAPETGRMKLYHWTRIIALSSFPQSDERARGRGLCAVSRTYEVARMILSANTYFYEKIVGQSPDVYFSSIPIKGFQSAYLEGLMDSKNKALEIFKNPLIISPRSGGVNANKPELTHLALRSIPDGFDYEKIVTMAVYMVAAGFGVDAREYWPATASGATKADAQVQDVKAESKGIGEIMDMLEDAFNWRILPDDITLEFDRDNVLIEEKRAANRLTRINGRVAQTSAGIISIDEARRLMAEDGDIDPAFLEEITSADDSANVNEQADNPNAEMQEPNEPEEEEEDDVSSIANEVAQILQKRQKTALAVDPQLREFFDAAFRERLAQNRRSAEGATPETIIPLIEENGLSGELETAIDTYFDTLVSSSSPEVAKDETSLPVTVSDAPSAPITVQLADGREIGITQSEGGTTISLKADGVAEDTPFADTLAEDDKGYDEAEGRMRNQILDAARIFFIGGNRRSVLRSMRLAVTENIETAFRAGLRDGGYRKQTLTRALREKMNERIQFHNSHLPGLLDWIAEMEVLDPLAVDERLSLWVNKALNVAYIDGVGSAKPQQMMVWSVGPTEHCSTCFAADGQVHSFAEWEAAGVLPQGDGLECGGFKCQCKLTPTDLPESGAIPKAR